MYLIAEFVPIALPESCELPWLDSVGFRVATGVAKPQEDRAYLPAGLGQESYRRNEKMDALYACGSNRLGQLSGNPSIHGDISSFQQIAGPYAYWHQLYANWKPDADDEHIYSLGVPNSCELPVPACHVRCVFGSDENGVAGIVTTSGELYCLKNHSPIPVPKVLQRHTLRTGRNNPLYSSRLNLLAIAGNGRAAATCLRRKDDVLSTLIVLSPALEDIHGSAEGMGTNSNRVFHYIRPSQPKQLLGNASAFLMLMQDGTVYTWGDPRYGVLGRYEEEGFDIPSRVTALTPHQIVKVASGGFLTAALTKDGQLYVWGVARPGAPQLPFVAQDKPVALQVINSSTGVTVVDIAVGDNHMIALTSDGVVFGIGEGANGELGDTDPEAGYFVTSWSQITTPSRSRIKGIACGRQSTFLVCHDPENLQCIPPNGDAVQIMNPIHHNQAEVFKQSMTEAHPILENERDVESSDDSELPIEGPQDWFRGNPG